MAQLVSSDMERAATADVAAAALYEGEIMAAVQRLDVFPDCKTFVDMPMRTAAEAINEAWAALDDAGRSDAATVAQFVRDHFDDAGHELEPWTPEDWTPGLPARLAGLDDEPYRRWAEDLHALWPTLGRRVSAKRAPTSLTLGSGARVIVPGGRFREIYYWDTFWIVEGLVVSGMALTAEVVTRNLLDLCHRVGSVPNGSRSYYADRSQPPLLSAMVCAVARALPAAAAAALARDALPVLEAEHAYWTSGDRVVHVDGHDLARFASTRTTPRPESYREDVATAAVVSPGSRRQLHLDLAAAAASGWDFSTRWMGKPGAPSSSSVEAKTQKTRHDRLARTAATRVISVDLNAFLLGVEANLTDLFATSGSADRARHFAGLAQRRRDAIMVRSTTTTTATTAPAETTATTAPAETTKAPTDRPAGRQEDPLSRRPNCGTNRAAGGATSGSTARLSDDRCAFVVTNRLLPPLFRRREFIPQGFVPVFDSPVLSDWSPMWVGLADGLPESKRRRLVETLAPLVCSAGVQTTSEESGEQWDAPNCWPPLQSITVRGLERLGLPEADALARQIKAAYLRTAHAAYVADGVMHEKYHARGGTGKGGEYDPQVGFGWSNGVALSFLADPP